MRIARIVCVTLVLAVPLTLMAARSVPSSSSRTPTPAASTGHHRSAGTKATTGQVARVDAANQRALARRQLAAGTLGGGGASSAVSAAGGSAVTQQQAQASAAAQARVVAQQQAAQARADAQAAAAQHRAAVQAAAAQRRAQTQAARAQTQAANSGGAGHRSGAAIVAQVPAT